MPHNHSDHNHGNNFDFAFKAGILLNTAYIIIEAGAGIIMGSLALIADAGHNLSDVLGLLIAWGASRLSMYMPTKKRTYGLKKSSILAALLNAVILLVAIGAISIEAIKRFSSPEPVQGNIMIIVAVAGVIINSVTALLFIKGKEEDLNIKGAFLHMAADALVSFGVVIGGIVIVYSGWFWIDPLLSLIISLVIIYGTFGLLKDSLNLAMDAVPENIDVKEVEKYLSGLDGVTEIHDLHIWAMSTTETALTVHIVKSGNKIDDDFTSMICRELHDKFGIGHCTIQFEQGQTATNCLDNAV